jgi:hypothetical protein
MKKVLLFIFFVIFHNYFCLAQNDSGRLNRLEAVKMAYMTSQVNLSPEEAQRFWPVYNTYNQEIIKAKRDYPNDVVGYESKVVEIRKKYQPQFQKVLNSPDRANKVFTSENNYRDLLRNEWQRRQQIRRINGGGGGPRMRPR